MMTFPCAVIGEGNAALECLYHLVDKGWAIEAVFTNTEFVAQFCDESGIKKFKRNACVQDCLPNSGIDYLFSINNPRVLKDDVLALPRKLCINFHDSPLPAYAGVNATNWALMNGETEHGITWHVVEPGIDTGDILECQMVEIRPYESALSLNHKCLKACLDAFKRVVSGILNNNLKPKAQDARKRSYYGLYDVPPNMGVLNFDTEASKAFDLTRALQFGTYDNRLGSATICSPSGHFLLVTKAELTQKYNNAKSDTVAPGTIIDRVANTLVVSRSTDSILLTVSELNGAAVTLEKYTVYNLTCGTRLRSVEGMNAVVAKEIRKKENMWRQKLKSYDPTVLPIQRLTWKPVGLRVSAASKKSEIIELPIMKTKKEDLSDEEYTMALFIAFFGRICCTTDVHIGLMADQENIPNQFKALYSNVCPGLFKIHHNETIDENVEQCLETFSLLREGKTFPRDLIHRYADLRDLKHSILHNMVLGIDRDDDCQDSMYENMLSDASMVVTLSKGKMKIFYEEHTETPFHQVLDVMHRFPIFLKSVFDQDHTVQLLEIPLLSAEELSKQISNFSEEDEEDSPEDVMDKFLNVCKAQPDHLALSTTDTCLTYGELEQEMKKLSRLFADVLPEEYKVEKKCLALHVPNSLAYVAGVLTCIHMKCPFLPVPTDMPLARLNFMLQDSRCTVMMVLKEELANTNKWANLPPLKTLVEVQTVFGHLVLIHFQVELNEQEKNPTFSTYDSPDTTGVWLTENCCYVIYTSGSTGKPKGVQCNRSGVVNLARAQINSFGLDPTDVFAQFASISFDATISEIFPALLSGATLAVLKDNQRLGKELMDTIKALNVTAIILPPAILNIYGPNDFPSLIKIVTAGEACTVPIAEKWTAVPKNKFFNSYGPAENTVAAINFEFCPKNFSNYALQDLPIGKAIPGTVVYLFDEFLKPVPPSVVGEIFIGGKSICDGYIGAAMSKNKERFIENPLVKGEILYRSGDHAVSAPDGTMTYIGRLDNQVKLRGQMVNLNEVEKVILQHPDAEMVIAVKHQSNKSADPAIVAFVAPMSVDADNLREFLSNVLPKHMIPTFIKVMNKEKFPMTLNGKVDRKKLELDDTVYGQNINDHSTCLNERQLAMAKLWCNVLKRDQSYAFSMSPQSSFSEMGGNSLHRVLLQRAIEEEFQVHLAFMDVVVASTIEEFDDVVMKTKSNQWATSCDQTASTNSTSLKEKIIADSVLDFIELPKNILLSGATGFLGAFLLREILEQTDAMVYCMVRDSTVKGAYEKLETNMRSYDLWKPGFESRISLVLSDMSKPKLGMASDVYVYLLKHIDTIFMNAAKTNFNTDYNDHKTVNVEGTKELINFALIGSPKYIFYTSTMSVFLFPPEGESKIGKEMQRATILESDILDDPSSLSGGYSQSKWVSEKLVLQALDKVRGGAVFRPTRVTGHSQTGMGSTADLFAAMMLGMEKMGVVPELDFPFDLTPVNFCARAMVQIMIQMFRNPAEEMPRVYHLSNKSTIPFQELFDGMDVRRVPLQEWRQELKRTDPDNELVPFTHFFMSDFWDRAHDWPLFNTDNTDRFTSEETRLLMPSSRALLKVYKMTFAKAQNDGLSRKRDIPHI